MNGINLLWTPIYSNFKSEVKMVFLKVIYKSDACIICLSTCKFIMKAKLNTLTQCFFFYQKHNSTIHGILELTKMSILSYHLQKLYLTEIFKETLYNNLSGHSRNPPPRKYTVWIYPWKYFNLFWGDLFFLFYIYIYITATYMHFLIYYMKKIPT